jgi:hypothetical protein
VLVSIRQDCRCRPCASLEDRPSEWARTGRKRSWALRVGGTMTSHPALDLAARRLTYCRWRSITPETREGCAVAGGWCGYELPMISVAFPRSGAIRGMPELSG